MGHMGHQSTLGEHGWLCLPRAPYCPQCWHLGHHSNRRDITGHWERKVEGIMLVARTADCTILPELCRSPLRGSQEPLTCDHSWDQVVNHLPNWLAWPRKQVIKGSTKDQSTPGTKSFFSKDRPAWPRRALLQRRTNMAPSAS